MFGIKDSMVRACVVWIAIVYVQLSEARHHLERRQGRLVQCTDYLDALGESKLRVGMLSSADGAPKSTAQIKSSLRNLIPKIWRCWPVSLYHNLVCTDASHTDYQCDRSRCNSGLGPQSDPKQHPCELTNNNLVCVIQYLIKARILIDLPTITISWSIVDFVSWAIMCIKFPRWSFTIASLPIILAQAKQFLA
jgi:hypothetical protein